jgi:hypothetical protein
MSIASSTAHQDLAKKPLASIDTTAMLAIMSAIGIPSSRGRAWHSAGICSRRGGPACSGGLHGQAIFRVEFGKDDKVVNEEALSWT